MGSLFQSETDSGIEIVQTIDKGDQPILDPGVQVVIDFSLPEAWELLDELLGGGKAALVSGTTGLGDVQMEYLEKWSTKRPVFYSSNMSVGIYVLGKLMTEADRMLGGSFDRELIEFHHALKADSPSGTALSLLDNWKGRRVYGRTAGRCARSKNEIGVHSIRGGDVTGEHHLHYLGQGERLVLSHIATDRRVFVQGALRAVKFICGKKNGLYGMEDMLG